MAWFWKSVNEQRDHFHIFLKVARQVVKVLEKHICFIWFKSRRIEQKVMPSCWNFINRHLQLCRELWAAHERKDVTDSKGEPGRFTRMFQRMCNFISNKLENYHFALLWKSSRQGGFRKSICVEWDNKQRSRIENHWQKTLRDFCFHSVSFRETLAK